MTYLAHVNGEHRTRDALLVLIGVPVALVAMPLFVAAFCVGVVSLAVFHGFLHGFQLSALLDRVESRFERRP